jgi:hypothetical protein
LFHDPVGEIVDITIEGRRYQVPDGWELLRCFQYLNFRISYERFCWNQRCENCSAKLREKTERVLCCRTPARMGLDVERLPEGVVP